MKIKKCTCCEKPLTTKNAIFKGRCEGILYWNCPNCQSTVVLVSKLRKQLMEKIRAAMTA